MTSLVTAWLTEVALISYRATQKGANAGTANVPLPLPASYASTFVVYGALALLPDSASAFAGLVGWGFVVATFLNLYNPIKSGQKTPTVATSGSKNAAGNTAA